MSVARWSVALLAASAGALACSSPSEQKPEPFVRPLPSGGTATGGAPAEAGSAGLGGSAAAGGAPAAACAEACQNGTVCRDGACKCPQSKPDTCGSTCVALSNDPSHCLTCDAACAAGAACTKTGCTPAPALLAQTSACGTIRLALRGTELYWVESQSGKVLSLSLAASNAEPNVIATGQLNPSGIAVDDQGVYWVNAGDGKPGSSQVMKKALPLTAAAPAPLVSGSATPPDSDVIRAIAVHDGTLLYTLVHDVHATSTSSAGPGDMVIGTATNYDATPPQASGLPSALAVAGNLVFWSTDERQGIERDDLSPGGDGYAELGQSQGSLLLRDLGTDGKNLYWANGESLVFCPVTKADGPGQSYLTGPEDFDAITAFAVSSSAVYFAGEKGSIFSHSLEATEPAVPPARLARDQHGVSAIVTSQAELVWATSDCSIFGASLP